MREYAKTLMAGTTPAVVRLRVAFLSLLAICLVLSAVLQFVSLPPLAMNICWIARSVLLVICGLMGPFVAWKDPAMSMKMLGGMLFIFIVFDAFDVARSYFG